MVVVTARLLARPIPQEYDASTVDEPTTHPAESGNLAAMHNLVEIAEACRRESDVGTRGGIRNCCLLLARPIPQEYDASTVELAFTSCRIQESSS